MSTETEIADLEPVTVKTEEKREESLKVEDERPHPGLPKSILREYFESAVVTVIMALFGITFVVQAVKVPTGSMENTIKVGDHLLVNKWIFSPHGKMLGFLPYRDIRRGDIIVFKYPGDTSLNYVKRVIALPHEKIEVRGTQVYINDKPLPEQIVWTTIPLNDKAELKPNPNRDPLIPADSAYQAFYGNEPFRKYNVYYYRNGEAFDDYDERPERHPTRSTSEENTPPCLFNEEAMQSNPGLQSPRFAVIRPCIIQEGQYFAMGDNRDNSQDSRFWGTVPRENIIGRALIVYWSLDEADLNDPSSEYGNVPESPFKKAVWAAKYFFTHTRWGDTGRLIK